MPHACGAAGRTDLERLDRSRLMSSAVDRIVFGNAWLRVLGRPAIGGHEADREDYFVVEVPDFALICPRTADARFLLVEQYRPAVERTVLEFPAGRIDPGESPSESIGRELVEETGHRPTRLVPLGGYFADTGRLSSRAHLFYGDVEPVADWTPEPGLIAAPFSAAEIDRLIADGRIAALHHVGLWLLVKAAGLAAP
jgi:ADP-ribose pyrophosphatase